MNLIAKNIVSLVIAAIAAALIVAIFDIAPLKNQLLLLGIIFIATVTTAMIFGSKGAAITQGVEGVKEVKGVNLKHSTGDANREHGTVKWFNGSKGFGFIVKDNGEEIFVHFRSIRGEGRRGLRDGQAVTFVVAQSDKGPQAEDVIGEE